MNKTIMLILSMVVVLLLPCLLSAQTGREIMEWLDETREPEATPALRKVRRISASEGGDSFMGTEFSYDDQKSREIDFYTYTFLRNEETLGYECWVIESPGKARTDSQYSRVLTWGTKDRNIMRTLRMELFGKDGELEKIFTVHKLNRVDGYWIPMSGPMENTRTGRATRLVQQRIELDRPVNPRRFTTRFLETGRTD